MGRGRQKAKQKKIARKLKYLTTDTDYDELAKELNARQADAGSEDSSDRSDEGREFAGVSETDDGSVKSFVEDDEDSQEPDGQSQEDLDEYAKWAAEAAAKSTQKASGPFSPKQAPHKPFPMPIPSVLRKPSVR